MFIFMNMCFSFFFIFCELFLPLSKEIFSIPQFIFNFSQKYIIFNFVNK